MSKRLCYTVVMLTSCLVFCVSCVGVKADLEFRANGSGTLSLEYRVSRMVETMGKLDGNERYLPLPVSKTDFERSVARVEGLSLKAFSQKENETEITILADLAFSTPAALLSFLDATGRSARYTSDKGSNTLSLRLSEGSGPLDKDLEKLVQTVFKDYSLELSVRTPTLPTSSAVGRVTPGNRTARFNASMVDVLTAKDPVSWDISWKD